MSLQERIVVAAIDFGTTYSGYVFSLGGDETKFYSPQSWPARHGQSVSLKTPTSLLLNPNQTFNSFGYEAEDRFAELAIEEKQSEYYFFQKFKMNLHFKSLKKDSSIDDISGKPMSALKVFSLSIKYLKDHCVGVMKDRGILSSNPKDKPIITDPEEIKFVLTVPAIWTDRSKHFMRVSAVEAGIADKQLTLALEPEAASVFCQRVPIENLQFEPSNRLKTQGIRYLVADIGGGTADYSVHEVEVNGSLTELYRASGGPYGGIYVDQEYLKIYDIIFGKGTLDQLKREDMVEYLTITRDFETKKRTVSKDYDKRFVIRLSHILNEKHSAEEKARRIESSSLKNQVTVAKDKLFISPELMKSFFSESLENIVKHVEEILKSIQNIDTILLVGGYSESPLLQEKFKAEFKGKHIIIPQDCGLAVMKGAVLFGFNPQSIAARVLRYSYGSAVHPNFDPEKHPHERRYYDKEGTMRCKEAFAQIIAKNTKLPSSGKKVTHNCTPLFDDQRSYSLRLYFTEKDNPIVIDESFQKLGTLEISAPDHIKGIWEAEEVFVFGQTEIQISARVKGTDEYFETTLDLLE